MTTIATTLQVVKLAGVGNIGVEEVPVPEPSEGEVLVRLRRSLISRGSEIGRRYLAEEALDHRIMGYSAAGEIAALGPGRSLLIRSAETLHGETPAGLRRREVVSR